MTLSLQLRVLFTYHICWGYSLLTTTSVEGTLYLPHLLRVLFTYHYICWGYSLLTTTSVEDTLYLPLHLLRVLFTYHYICWEHSLLTTTSVEGTLYLPLHLSIAATSGYLCHLYFIWYTEFISQMQGLIVLVCWKQTA